MPIANSNGATIYYEVRGASGPPLVMVRGFASPIGTWNGVDHDLAADHTVVVLDNRGVGRSGCPRGPYSAAVMAEDVAAVMSDAGFQSAHVFGTSLGGMIAQELAIQFPDRVRSLALGATTAGRGHGRALRPSAVTALVLAAIMPRPIKARLAAWATLSPTARAARAQARRAPASCDRASASRREAPAPSPLPLRGLIGQAFAVFGHRAGTRLATIVAPTLILHGEADKLVDPRHAEQLARLIPSSRLHLLAGVGHDLATEAPDHLADMVRCHVRASANS
jgi:pimeloyl-ACP methyl ester carboxylesterase